MSRTLQSQSFSGAPITGDELNSALRALDVNFIMGGQSQGESLHNRPARLIAALADGPGQWAVFPVICACWQSLVAEEKIV